MRVGWEQVGGVDPKAYHPSYMWQTWQTYHDHDPFDTLPAAVMANRSLMLGSEVDMWCDELRFHLLVHALFQVAGAAFAACQDRYVHDACCFLLTARAQHRGEGVDDTNFETSVFPRTTAAAERMWSWDESPAAAETRLSSHRCQLVAAGVRVGPIGPGAPCSAVQVQARAHHL